MSTLLSKKSKAKTKSKASYKLLAKRPTTSRLAYCPPPPRGHEAFHFGPRLDFRAAPQENDHYYNDFLVIEMLCSSFPDPRATQHSHPPIVPLAASRTKFIESVHLIPEAHVEDMYNDNFDQWDTQHKILRAAVEEFPCVFYNIAEKDVALFMVVLARRQKPHKMHLSLKSFYKDLSPCLRKVYKDIKGNVSDPYYVAETDEENAREIYECKVAMGYYSE